MTPAPANISDCQAPVNSSRDIHSALLSYTVGYLATYDPPGAKRITQTATFAPTWGRKTFPRDGAEQQPGIGQFFIAQDCCCPCRARFVFDDSAYTDQPEIAATIISPFEITRIDQALDDDGNDDGDPTTTMTERFFDLRLWIRADAPCREPGGSQGTPTARLYVPLQLLHAEDEDQFDPGNGDSIDTSVTGTYGVRIDESGLAPVDGYQPFIFDLPEPCSNLQDFELTINKEWVIVGLFTASSAITVSFSMA